MKVLVVSHTLNVDENFGVFDEIAASGKVEIIYAVPRKWKNEYGFYYTSERIIKSSRKVWPQRVYFNGNIPLHFYGIGILRLIRNEKPDIVYIHNEPYSLSAFEVAVICKFTRIPIIFYSAQNIRKVLPIPFQIMEKFVYKQSSACLPITKEVADVIKNKEYKGTMYILPLSIQTSLYSGNINRKIADTTAKIQIIYVGRFTEEKGLLTLFNALSDLLHLNWKLTMIGNGKLKETLVSKAEAGKFLDRIDFKGFIPHGLVPEILATMDLIVLPSETQSNWKEQFGRVLVEGAASAVATLGSDSGEIPILINDLGGDIFPERNVLELRKSLEKLISDKVYLYSKQTIGRANAIKKYSHAKIAEKMIKIMFTVVKESEIVE